MKFDVVLTNPPFQDTLRRKKTPHKLWIDFTKRVFWNYLREGGSYVQVSPTSFSSPSNGVLEILTKHQTKKIRLGTEAHFPGIGSTFSDYWIVKTKNGGEATDIESPIGRFACNLDDSVLYLPNDFSQHSLEIHKKVMFANRGKLLVEWDYVVAHNIRRHDPEPTLKTEETDTHRYPVFHTNRSVWWSSVEQPWARSKKVMWTRSGYTRPFFDDGVLGGTDMVYFIRVDSQEHGQNLVHNLNSTLFRYIFKTARWSGFGNERVFAQLPELPVNERLDDRQIFELFGLSSEEVEYVERFMASRKK